MNLKINDKDYELHFGLDFIAHLNKKHTSYENGYELGRGIYNAVIQIQNADPTILVDLIEAATITEPQKPTREQIKQFIESIEDAEVLMDDFLSVFEKAPMTRPTMKKIQEMEKEVERLMKQERKKAAQALTT